MKARRRIRHSKSRRSRGAPPPLPLVCVEPRAFQEAPPPISEKWELVGDDELMSVKPPCDSGEQPFPLVSPGSLPLTSSEGEGGTAGEACPETWRAVVPVTELKWKRYAAVLALAALAALAAWLPAKRWWLPGTAQHSGAAPVPAKPAESMVYVVPITVFGQAPARALAGAMQRAGGEPTSEP